MDSPAAAFARAARRSRYPHLNEFAAMLSFELDEFQITACQSLEDGHGVLVCAPTGAGKTVVGEFAVHLALARGQGCAYTAPIKALSNQKYADLVRRHGSHNVGLLTGDNSINPHAPILVMTTEVLRNMLYVGSDTVDRLGFVVMDEVHYLADRFRGAVWEEVIIHLPEQVQLASLSATVSNAEEFGAWLHEVRGNTDVVVTEHRPVPLWQHMMLGNRLYDLLAEKGRKRLVNPELERASRQQAQRVGNWSPGRGGPRGRRGSWRPQRRTDVIEKLDRQGLLPAIYFIFSRVGCDAALEQCRASGVRLLDDLEREEVRRTAMRRTSELSEADLEVLGFWEWLDALEHGYAAHHAGMIPAFKETVEDLFVRGLCKVVFATETLALGINMPARSVVLERLVKFNGENHVRLTPGEYTQLTGRAGRRGIDIEGHAVTLWSPDISPAEVANLATTRTFPLKSSFKPSYNMAVNLVGQLGRAASKQLLERSFAQYQADRAAVGLATRREQAQQEARSKQAEVTCERGDVTEYADLRRQISDIERSSTKARNAARRDQVASSMKRLRRGDIIEIPSGKHRGVAVVLESHDQPAPHLTVLTGDRWSGRVEAASFHGQIEPIGRMKVNKSFNHRSAQARRDLGSNLTRLAQDLPRPARVRPPLVDHEALATLRTQLRAHPVHSCPDREQHVRDLEDARAAWRASDRLASKLDRRTASLGRTFDRICQLLTDLGYLADDDTMTEAGRLLSRLWSESDLLIAQCLRTGAWDELTAADLAAVVSATLYEPRSGDYFDTATVPVGSKRVRAALARLHSEWAMIEDLTSRIDAQPVRRPDPGFALAAYRWTSGDSLAVVLSNLARAGVETAPGDFVRWCRQVIDVLEQLARLDPGQAGAVPSTAARAVAAMRRGVLADPTRPPGTDIDLEVMDELDADEAELPDFMADDETGSGAPAS
ncbi:RNA helicase [Blastococcus sp. Marseille-P5729]|uniref:DEAD/DEAH box helicase n=1 Tax=Blastococcus sp. Marseille-P5729 TaxID=2086582 RepID=UPI000D0E6BFE|nr:DEAD/DEAH box helicase [Blastococcus sp. Marseille-P5729]